MDIKVYKANAKALTADLQWLGRVIDARMKLYWDNADGIKDVYDVEPPDLSGDHSLYAEVVMHYKMSFAERVILLLSIAPHMLPHLLDVFFVKNANYDRAFTEFGGIKGQHHSGFIPTGETASFLLAANDLEKRFQVIGIFDSDHFFSKYRILKITNANADEPLLSGVLNISVEYLNYFTNGVTHKPDYNINFPAKLIQTSLDWNDLVLNEQTLQEVMEISDWIRYGDTLLNEWGMKKIIKPGYRTLFYGPPGTGKTLTATLLGRTSGLDVYRIDLSMVVSKFIGETEKNLANIFDQAQNKNWILFFDEADALFGKRTQTTSSNDRYANQEISYLLQRIEDFPGVVILASNLKANLDDAFARRFQSMIQFNIPSPHERKRIWEKAFSTKSVLEDQVDLDEISRKYEMTGGGIINISRYCSLVALKNDRNCILLKDILEGIRREYGKEGKTI